MANRDWQEKACHGQGLIDLHIVLQGTGAAAPTVLRGGHIVESVTRSATGRIAVVFRDYFVWFETIFGGYQDTNHATTPTRKVVNPVRDNATNAVVNTVPARTIEFAIEDIANAGTVTLSDLTTTQRAHLYVTARNSSAKP